VLTIIKFYNRLQTTEFVFNEGSILYDTITRVHTYFNSPVFNPCPWVWHAVTLFLHWNHFFLLSIWAM